MAAARKCSVICVTLVVTVSVFSASSPVQALPTTEWLTGTAPDWNQPYDYPAAYIPGGGPGPWPVNPVGSPWRAWCVPSSASNMVGYWEDARGTTLADGLVFPATVPWGGPSWHDYNAQGVGRPAIHGNVLPGATTDLGWYLDTNNRGASGAALRNNDNDGHVGTYIKDIHAGIADYLNTRAPGWLQSVPNGAVKTEGRIGSGVQFTTNPANPAQTWPLPSAAFAEVQQEIDSNRPVIISWLHWNLNPAAVAPLGGTGSGESSYGGTYYTFGSYSSGDSGNHEVWNGSVYEDGLGHAVTAVGYITAGSVEDPGLQLFGHTNDWVIVHDNWPTINGVVVRNVIVPFDMDPIAGGQGFVNWVANTTMVPEPGACVLLITAGFSVLLVAWRRRK